MEGSHILEALAALGGLSGIGTLVTSLAGLMETRRHLRPNHGSSLADAIHRMERDVTALHDDIRSLDHRLGYEIGELKSTNNREHSDYEARLRELERIKYGI